MQVLKTLNLKCSMCTFFFCKSHFEQQKEVNETSTLINILKVNFSINK